MFKGKRTFLWSPCTSTLSASSLLIFNQYSRSNDSSSTDNLNPCQVAQINVAVCQTYWISQIIFSLLFLVWNLLVSVVLVSVARTQVHNYENFILVLYSKHYYESNVNMFSYSFFLHCCCKKSVYWIVSYSFNFIHVKNIMFRFFQLFS